MAKGSKLRQRPKKRNITRWNDDLDELLLLTIHSVCSNESIKIPWAEVAEEMTAMGYSTTDGAIIQHLSKIRVRRQEKNKQVPAPLKRGFAGGSTKSSRRTKATGPKSHASSASTSDEEQIGHRVSTRSNAKAAKKSTRVGNKPMSDEDYLDECDTSDEDLVSNASFLDFPNARRGKAPKYSPARTPKKIITYKCPKPFLEGLEKEEANGHPYVTAQTGTHAMPDSMMEFEPVSESGPAMALQLNAEPVYQSPLNPTGWAIIPDDPFVESRSMLAEYNIGLGQTGPGQNMFPHPLLQPQAEMETTYIPTGNASIDLPPIDEIFSSSVAFDDSLPPLQGFQLDQTFIPEQGFQEMLEEDYNLNDLAWYD
ncbi:hypothetical protein BDV18DRAFT_159517 [Aspergillus unguis]